MKEPFKNLHSTLSHNVMVLSYSLLNSLNNEHPHQIQKRENMNKTVVCNNTISEHGETTPSKITM